MIESELNLMQAEILGKILGKLDEAIIVTERSGKILFVTPSIQRIGLEPEELVSKKFTSFVHPADAGAVKKAFRTLESVEVRLVGRKGIRWVKIGFETLPKKLILVLKDVTELKEKEDLISKLEEKTHTGIYIAQEGRFVYVNRKLSELTGYSEEELLKMNPFDLVHPDDREIVRERYYKREIGEEVPEHYEWRILTRKGDERWIEVIATRVEFNGKPAVLGNVFDITHRKEMEEKLKKSEMKYRNLLEAIKDTLFVIDTKGRFVFLNKKFEELSLYSVDEWIGRNFVDLVAPEHRKTVVENFKKGISGKSIPPYEIEIVRKDGRRVFVELNVTNIYEKGEIVGRIGIARDVSERKNIEKKLMESEEMFRRLAEKSHIGIYLIQDGVFKYVNPRLAELWGYSVEELIGKDPLNFVHPADRELVNRNLRLRIEGSLDSINYKLRMIRKDGETRINEVYGSKIVYNGRPAVIGTLIDITESEKYREELERYKRFYENAHDLFFILDSKARFVEVNPKYAELLGYRKEELIGHTARKLMDPDEIEMVREMFRKVMEGRVVRYEAKAIPKDKKKTYLMEVTLWPILEKGKVIGAEGIVRDITDKKRMEEELRKKEKWFRALVENSADIMMVIDETARIKYISPSVKRVGGYEVEEIVGGSAFNFAYPEDVDFIMENLRYVLENPGLPKTIEFRAVHKDGRVLWVEATAQNLFHDPAVNGIVVNFRDITERKVAEQLIRESEEKYRLIVENTKDVIKVLDTKGVRTYVSPSAEKILGYKPEEMIGRSAFENIHPEDVRRAKREFFSLINEKKHIKLVYRYRKKDGSYIWAESVAAPLFKDGSVEGAVVVTRDISERIELQEKLRKSEEKHKQTAEYLQNLINVAPVPIVSWDSEYRITLWNKAAEERFGWKAEEALGKNLLEIQVPEEERNRVKKVLDGVEEGKPVVNINPTLTKDGDRRIYEWYNFAIGRNEGKITTSIGIDLTDRIEMEKKLVENERKFRKLFETSPILIAVLDRDGTFIEANPAMIKSIGFNPIGKKLADVFPAKVAQRRMLNVKETIGKNKRIEFEDTRKHRYFHNVFMPVTLKGKRYCFVVARDVTAYIRLNKLLTAINEINKLIVHERDRKTLLEKACRILASLRDYYSVWLGMIEGDKLVRIAGEELYSGFSVKELPACFTGAFDSVKIVKTGEKSQICPYREGFMKFNCTIVPMRVENVVKGFVVVHSKETLPEREEIEMLQTLADDLAFAIKALELEEARKKAFEQIEKNIEQYAILVDQIRNPLAIISGLAELKAGEELGREINEQVDRIEMLIRKLDRGWLESEAVRDFLKRTLK